MPKFDFSKVAFIEIALRNECFPVNLLHIFIIPSYHVWWAASINSYFNLLLNVLAKITVASVAARARKIEKTSHLKKFLYFQEMELSDSKLLRNFLCFKNRNFLIFQKTETLKNFLYSRK